MPKRGAIEFEPVVEFPAEPIAAARMYLGVMAYPELGAGQIGGRGVRFSSALGQYVIWQRRKAHGLRDIRRIFADPAYSPPHRREFEGALERGRRRLLRRFAAYDVVGNQLINGFFNARLEAGRLLASGRSDEAFYGSAEAKYRPIRKEIWKQVAPSAREILGRDLTRSRR